MKKKNAQPTKGQSSAKRQRDFTGTDNPRHLRAVAASQLRPIPREELDSIVGCSNGPELAATLRAKGLNVPCAKVPYLDRDGTQVLRGVYYLSNADRRKIARWLCNRAEGGEC
ncbi:MAG TPA: hypothetical protein VF534_38275 [Paraburkholderia sp.]